MAVVGECKYNVNSVGDEMNVDSSELGAKEGEMNQLVYNGGSSQVYIRQFKSISTTQTMLQSVAVKIVQKPSRQAEREIKVFNFLRQDERYKEHVVEIKKVMQSSNEHQLHFENLKTDGWERVDYFLKRITSGRREIGPRQKWKALMDLTKSMARSVLYLHSKGITHRDLKLDHFYRLKKQNHVKIIDFGLSSLSSNPHHLFCGTLPYTAPEMWGADGYTNSVDVWSLGICFYFMFYNSFPFHSPISQNLTIWEIQNGSLSFPPLSTDRYCKIKDEQVRDLLLGMLNRNVQQRLTIQQVLKHSCFRSRQE